LFEYLLDHTGEAPFEKRICTCLGMTRKLKIKGRTPKTVAVTVPCWVNGERNCTFVLTDSFHGTVFALIFHKPFVALLKTGADKAQNERIVSLLTPLGLADRMFDAYDEARIDAVLRDGPDWGAVDRAIAGWRQRAAAFLNRFGL